MNKSVKVFTCNSFREWYRNAIYKQLQRGPIEDVDLQLGVMKLNISCMIQCFEYLISHPELDFKRLELKAHVIIIKSVRILDIPIPLMTDYMYSV